MKNRWGLLAFALAFTVLSGCGSDEHQDIREWMKNEERGMRGRVEPLPQVKPYEPRPYEGASLIDPFNMLKVKVEGDRSSANLPDLNRPREPLEEFPLEGLRLVGILQDKQRLIAQVIANGRSHQVRVGNYIGQNFGRVVRIVTTKNEERIVIKELVKDPDDQWVEKESELLLDSRGAQ
jgi:type IV pilus assembly protein PilP